MKKIGIGVDYSNICKDYNTAYLDRDNKDPDTAKCMKSVVAWTTKFLSALLENFGYQIYSPNADIFVKIEDVASNRFLFYSLEKEITLQSFVIQKSYVAYDSLSTWEEQASDSILVKNDEDGEGIYFYFNEGSKEHEWILAQLKNFSIDEVPFQAK
jgi:hypothetical protein